MNNNSKLCSVISYITWIGWIIALLIRDKEDALVRRHLNQALILNIISSVAGIIGKGGGFLSLLTGLVGLGCFILAIMGIVRAVNLSEEPLPLVGGIELIK